jgi:DNA mismatch endonuclease (patch repair protein)
MSALARKDTAPEMALRRILHQQGLRYFVHRRPLPDLRREADIVFPRAKVAVFVDGCFWHGCREHGTRVHRINSWYWSEKIQRNKDRDRDTDESLKRAGWEPVRIWEHVPASEAAHSVQTTIESLQPSAQFAGLDPASRGKDTSTTARR